jgi:hypothetical protein
MFQSYEIYTTDYGSVDFWIFVNMIDLKSVIHFPSNFHMVY